MIDVDFNPNTNIEKLQSSQTSVGEVADKIAQTHGTQQKGKLLTISEKSVEKNLQSNIISKQSLPKPDESFDSSMAEILFAQIRSKLSEQVDRGSVADIRLNMQRLKTENKKLIAKLQEHLKKLEEAKHRSIWAKIFGWIGAILGTIVGAIAAVFTGGASIGLLVAGIIGLTVCTLNETGAMQKIASALAKAIEKSLIADGVSPEKAKQVGMILSQVVIAAAVIIASIGAGAATSGIGPLVQLSTRALSIAQMATKAGTAAASLSGIGAGSSQIAAGVSQGQSMQVQAETIELKGLVNGLQSAINANVKNLEDVSKSNNAIMEKVNQIVQTRLESRSHIISQV